MKLKRYYINQSFKENDIVILDDEEFHHLKNVMRSREGEHVILFNGTPVDALGKIVKINKNNAEIKILEIKENLAEPTINLTLFQAVCKGDKLSLITQKTTELGVNNICVFYSKFTDIKDKTSKLDKLERVSINASKQCGRSSIIDVEGVISFEEMLEKTKSCDKVFCAYENAQDISLFSSLCKNSKYKNIGLIIGAEGGFSEDEIKLIEKNNIEIVTLGKRILRTETAAIVGCSTLLFACEN